MEKTEISSKQEVKSFSSFFFEGKAQPVSYVETMHVAEGVNCDIYEFVDDLSKDLGIIKISSGSKTPLQKVLKGDRTVEGFISGKGKLTVVKADGKREVYVVGGETEKPIEVAIEIGEVMQWEADKGFKLVAYEICFPPYEDGRYDNLT